MPNTSLPWGHLHCRPLTLWLLGGVPLASSRVDDIFTTLSHLHSHFLSPSQLDYNQISGSPGCISMGNQCTNITALDNCIPYKSVLRMCACTTMPIGHLKKHKLANG